MGAGKREFLMSQVRNLRARLQQHRLWEIVRTWVDWMWEDVKKEESRVFLYFFFSLLNIWVEGSAMGKWRRNETGQGWR